MRAQRVGELAQDALDLLAAPRPRARGCGCRTRSRPAARRTASPPVPDASCTIPPTSPRALAPHRDHVAPVAHRDRHVGHAVMRLEPRPSRARACARARRAPRAARGGCAAARATRRRARCRPRRSRARSLLLALARRPCRSANGASTARSDGGRRSGRAAPRACGATSAAARRRRAARAPLQTMPATRSRCERRGRLGDRLGRQGGRRRRAPRIAATRAMLALEPREVRRRARARARAPRPSADAAAGDELEQRAELENAERVRVHRPASVTKNPNERAAARSGSVDRRALTVTPACSAPRARSR